MEKPQLYERLSDHGKKVFDHNNWTFSDRFIELMNQEEPSKDSGEYMFYNQEERDFLGKEDLIVLADLHESDAYLYMMED